MIIEPMNIHMSIIPMLNLSKLISKLEVANELIINESPVAINPISMIANKISKILNPLLFLGLSSFWLVILIGLLSITNKHC